MKLWKKDIIAGIIGLLIGGSITWILGYVVSFLAIGIVSFVGGLYYIDQYYLKKGPQKYLKALKKNEIRRKR